MKLITAILIIIIFFVCYHIAFKQCDPSEHFLNKDSDNDNKNKNNKSVLQYKKKGELKPIVPIKHKDRQSPHYTTSRVHIDQRPIFVPVRIPIFTQMPTPQLTSVQPIDTHSIDKLIMYQCLLALHEIFAINQIWYTLTYSTLAYAVMNGAISKLDSPVTIFVKFDEIENIKLTLPLFESLGFKTSISLDVITIEYDEEHKINLMPIKEENGVAIRCATEFGICVHPNKQFDRWIKLYEFDYDLIRYQKLYKVGPLFLYGPSNAIELIKYWNSKIE